MSGGAKPQEAFLFVMIRLLKHLRKKNQSQTCLTLLPRTDESDSDEFDPIKTRR